MFTLSAWIRIEVNHGTDPGPLLFLETTDSFVLLLASLERRRGLALLKYKRPSDSWIRVLNSAFTQQGEVKISILGQVETYLPLYFLERSGQLTSSLAYTALQKIKTIQK
jgi:hypothetical protein